MSTECQPCCCSVYHSSDSASEHSSLSFQCIFTLLSHIVNNTSVAMESSILTWDNLERAYQQLSDQLHIGAAIQILGLTKLEAAELQGYIKRLLDEDLDRHGGTASPTPFPHEVLTKNWRSRFPGLEIWNTQPNLWIEAAFKKCIRAVEEYEDLESFVVSHEQFPLDESSSGDSTPGSSRSGNTQIPDCLFCADNCDCPPPTKYRHVSTEPRDDPRVNDSTWQHVDNPDSPGHEAFEDHLGFSTTGNPASSTTASPSSNQRPSTSAITGLVFLETDRSKHSERPHQAARLFPSATQTRNGLANFCPSPAPYTNQDLVPVATQSAREYRGRGPRGENTSAPRRDSRSPTRGPVPSGASTVRNPRARPSESYRPPPFLAPQIAPTSERHPLLSVQYEPMLNYSGAGSAALYPFHRREDPVRREDEDRGDRPSSSSAGPESTPRPVVRPLPFSRRPLSFTAGPSLYRQRSPPRHHSPPRQSSPPRYSPPRQRSPPRSPINRRPSPVYDDDPFERNDPDYRRPSPLALAHHDLHREGVTTTLVRDEIDDTRWIYRRHGSNSSDEGYYHNNPPRQRYVYKGPFRLRGGAAPRDSDSHHHHDSRRRDAEPPFELHGDDSPTSDVSSPPPPPNSPCASPCEDIFSTATPRPRRFSSSAFDRNSGSDSDSESSRTRAFLSQAINWRKEKKEDRPPRPIRPPSPQPPHPWVPYTKHAQINADHLTTAKEKGKALATELRPPRPVRPPSFLPPRPWVPYTNRADTEHLTTDWAYSPAASKENGKRTAAPTELRPLSPRPPCPWVPDEDTEPLTTSWRCSPTTTTTTKEKGTAGPTALRPPRPFRPLSPPPPRPWAPYSRTANTQGHDDGKHLIPIPVQTKEKEKEKGKGMGMNELRPPRPIRPPSPQPPRPWVPYSRGTDRDAQVEHPCHRHRHRAASRGRERSRRWEDSGSSSSEDESRVRRVSRDKEEEEEEVVLVRVRGRGVVDGLMRGGARVFD